MFLFACYCRQFRPCRKNRENNIYRTYAKLSQQGHALGNRPCKDDSLRRQAIHCLKHRLHRRDEDSTFVPNLLNAGAATQLGWFRLSPHLFSPVHRPAYWSDGGPAARPAARQERRTPRTIPMSPSRFAGNAPPAQHCARY